MNRIYRYLGVVAALGGALVSLAVAVPAAFAVPATFPPPDPQTGPGQVSVPHTIVLGGMPGWQITLIAAGAALAAAVAAVLLDRAWARRSGAHGPVLAARRRLPRGPTDLENAYPRSQAITSSPRSGRRSDRFVSHERSRGG